MIEESKEKDKEKNLQEAPKEEGDSLSPLSGEVKEWRKIILEAISPNKRIRTKDKEDIKNKEEERAKKKEAEVVAVPLSLKQQFTVRDIKTVEKPTVPKELLKTLKPRKIQKTAVHQIINARSFEKILLLLILAFATALLAIIVYSIAQALNS